ncbi:MAG: VanZ family protein [Pirellulales bacterium]|nr:VanZ family protein [Pirellulales bacterium]
MTEPTPDDPRWRRYAVRARTLAVAYFLVLATATHWPDVSTGGFSLSDKVIHLGAYLMLTVLTLLGWELTIGRLEPKHFFAVWLAGTLYGILDEVLQTPVGRDCDVHDWLADVLGIVLGLLVYQAGRALARRMFCPPVVQAAPGQ